MSEITKLYENAEIKPKYSGWLDMGDLDMQMEYIQCDTKEEWDECVSMSRCEYYEKPKMEYPTFTAEKQIELIKWLSKNKNGFGFFNDSTEGLSCHCDFHWEWFDKNFYAEDFENALAGIINNIWQDLTEEEKQQVKGILE